MMARLQSIVSTLRMSVWAPFWNGRNARERMLLGVATVSLALLLAWFGVFAPVLDARAGALRAHDAAMAMVTQMRDGAREAAVLRLATPEGTQRGDGAGEPVRAAASALARDMGLQISRIQPAEAGAAAFVFDSADAADLFLWIERLQSRYGAGVSAVTINRNADGRAVQASVLVLEAQ